MSTTAAFPRLSAASPPTTEAFRDAADAAARRGVVGVVAFENTDNPSKWPERVAGGVEALRGEGSVRSRHLDDAIARGLRDPALAERMRRVHHVPGKVCRGR